MSITTINDLQVAMQVASDGLAYVLAAGGDTTNARQALYDARAALQRHKDAKEVAERERMVAELGETDRVAALAAAEATSSVTASIERVQLPEGVLAPAPIEQMAVVAAAADKARVELEIHRGEPARQKARDEVIALTKRAEVKRAEVASIRSRRLAGHEEADDAARLYLLDADASDLDGLVQAAQQRLQALAQPVAELRRRLVDIDGQLKSARVNAALHGQADRVRALEQALVASVRELRSNAAKVNRHNLPSYFKPSQGLRDVANGIAP
jgi:hypothetical protein